MSLSGWHWLRVIPGVSAAPEIQGAAALTLISPLADHMWMARLCTAIAASFTTSDNVGCE